MLQMQHDTKCAGVVRHSRQSLFISTTLRLVCSRLVGTVDAGVVADMGEDYEDDDIHDSTHRVTLTNRHDGGNFYTAMFIRHPRTSEPPSNFCRSIYTGSDECLERREVWLQECLAFQR